MLLSKQNFRLVCLWLCLISSFAAGETDIIYEYEIITQKKQQPFEQVFTHTHLNSKTLALINRLPLKHQALSQRQFLLIYQRKNQKLQFKALKVTRGNRKINFVLVNNKGHEQLINQDSQIPATALKTGIQLGHKQSLTLVSNRPTIKLASSAKPIQLTSNEALFAIDITQQKGQPFNQAIKPAKFSKLQRQIISTGDFRQQAISTRQLIFYFSGDFHQKLLRGMTVHRDGKHVTYVVEKKNNQWKLNSLSTLTGKQQKIIAQQFSQATTSSIAKAKTLVQTNSPKIHSQSKSTLKTIQAVLDSGKYRLLTIVQEKGQALTKAIKPFLLSHLQSHLITHIPVISKAKSRRYFYLLFEKDQGKKYLKAARVVRGKNIAEFVLVKDDATWKWANSRGQIEQPSGFLRYPLNFKRISSPFNLRRRHPITRRIRPHKGVDLKAAHGTPIWAPADGVVSFAGRQRGYGILLEIDHKNGYKTRYAHLSRIARGLRKGKWVKKRQIIARVGNTGASTGAHLHYEVRINNRPKNPLTVKLPGGGGSKTLATAKEATKLYLPKIVDILKRH